MNPEEKYRRIQDAGMAARDLAGALPTLTEHIHKQYKRVKASMAANGDVLDPEVAIQAWYAVFAALEVEDMLKRIVKKGRTASQA